MKVRIRHIAVKVRIRVRIRLYKRIENKREKDMCVCESAHLCDGC